MRIVYHLGVHCTDDERLLRCLLRNRATLSAQGIVVPGPTRYRTLLRDTAMTLRGQPASRDTQAMILDQIMDEDRAERLILSWENFMGYAQSAIRDRLYPAAAERMFAFSQIFPDIECEFHLALRNPATFVPAVALKQQALPVADFVAATDPDALLWSDLVNSLRTACPQVPITVWCDEDTPLLWPEVLAVVSGHAEGVALEGVDDLLSSIMHPDGMLRMAAYLESHPPADQIARRQVVSAFLDKYALPDVVEMDVELPGWTEDTIARLTAAYDADVAKLMRTEGVSFLTP